MSEENPRRGMDKTVRVILTSLTLTLVGQGAGALIYAGRLDERIKYIEQYVKASSSYEYDILVNKFSSNENSKHNKKVLKLLKTISDRQRQIELKIERLSK